MQLTVNVYLHPSDQVVQKLDSIIGFLTTATFERKHIMATLDQIKANVEAETTLIQGVSTLINGLLDQVKNLPGITPEQQAEIDNISATVEANKAALAAALAANTPAPAPVVTEPAPAAPDEPAAA